MYVHDCFWPMEMRSLCHLRLGSGSAGARACSPCCPCNLAVSDSAADFGTSLLIAGHRAIISAARFLLDCCPTARPRCSRVKLAYLAYTLSHSHCTLLIKSEAAQLAIVPLLVAYFRLSRTTIDWCRHRLYLLLYQVQRRPAFQRCHRHRNSSRQGWKLACRLHLSAS